MRYVTIARKLNDRALKVNVRSLRDAIGVMCF